MKIFYVAGHYNHHEIHVNHQHNQNQAFNFNSRLHQTEQTADENGL